MKTAIRTLVIGLCLCLSFGLLGCQQEKKTDDKLDTDLGESKNATYFLIVGNDSRIGTKEITKENYADGTGRSDTIMLARVDSKTHLITLVSIPRDTMATYNGQKVKINETYRLGGIEELNAQVATLTGVKADYYLDLGFVTFEQFIEDLGGIHANVPIDMSLKDIIRGGTVALKAGDQDLDGKEALVLSRFRKGYAADVMEGSRQNQNRQIVQVAIEKVLADPSNSAKYLASLTDNVKTDISATELSALVTDFIDNKDEVKILSGTGPNKGDIDSETELWFATRDEETWHKLMEHVDGGGNPTDLIALDVPRAA